jgi:hypothetical protein
MPAAYADCAAVEAAIEGRSQQSGSPPVKAGCRAVTRKLPVRQLPVHAALLAGLVLAALLAWFVLTALPALMLLVGFVLTALLAGLAALLRVALVLLIALRILVLVSHLGCSPVSLETPARQGDNPKLLSRFLVPLLQFSATNWTTSKNTYREVNETPFLLPS